MLWGLHAKKFFWRDFRKPHKNFSHMNKSWCTACISLLTHAYDDSPIPSWYLYWLTRTMTKGTTYQWLKHFEFFNICAMIWDKFVHIFQVLVNKTKEMFFSRPEGLDTSCGTMCHHWRPRYHQITYRLKQHLVAEYCQGAKFV